MNKAAVFVDSGLHVHVLKPKAEATISCSSAQVLVESKKKKKKNSSNKEQARGRTIY